MSRSSTEPSRDGIEPAAAEAEAISKCHVCGRFELRVDHARRTIGFVEHSPDSPLETDNERRSAQARDASQWSVFRCVSTEALAPRFSWDPVEFEPSAIEFTKAEWQQIRRARRALLAELPMELRGYIVRMRFPWLTFYDIERMWKALDVVRGLAEADVRLLSLWLCLPVWRLHADGKVASRFKSALREQYGLAPAVWRALCRWRWRLFPAGETHRSVVARRMHAQAYLCMLGTDRIEGVPRSCEKRQLWHLAASAPATFCKGDEPVRALMRHVRKELAAGQPIDEFDRMEMLCALWDIEIDPDRFRPDANQKRAGWRWWLRRLQELDAESREPTRRETWTCPVDTFKAGGYLVVPLRCSAALHEEGRRLSNCLATLTDNYAMQCLKHDLRLYSIRLPAQGERSVGVVALGIDGVGRPRVRESAGNRNADLPRFLEPVVSELLQRYRDSPAQLPRAESRVRRTRMRRGEVAHAESAPRRECAVDPAAMVSIVITGDESEHAKYIREYVHQQVACAGRTILLLSDQRGSSMFGLPWQVPIRTLVVRKRTPYEALVSRLREDEKPACLIAQVPDSITAISVRLLVEAAEAEGESPRAVMIDASTHDARSLSEELDALAGFLGTPICVVSTGNVGRALVATP